MEILSSPTIWTVIVAIAAIVIIPITIRQQKRKELTYEVASFTIVLKVNAGKEVKSRVQVLLDGQPVQNACVVILKIWNSGNVPIKREDFDNNQPLKIYFRGKTQVLEAEVLETVPGNIGTEAKTSLKLNPENITIDPLLLNSRDLIVLRILVADLFYEDNIRVNARIIGGKIINWKDTELYKSYLYIKEIGNSRWLNVVSVF